MAKEADFYSTGEVAKALGIPESRVFGMLAGGELEGQQDEWARWRIPASAVSRVRRAPELSSNPDRNLEEDAGSPAAGAEARAPRPRRPSAWLSPSGSRLSMWRTRGARGQSNGYGNHRVIPPRIVATRKLPNSYHTEKTTRNRPPQKRPSTTPFESLS